MRRVLNISLAVLVLLACLTAGGTGVQAAKVSTSRAIAIVFDNSGSMYQDGNQAWCRATYAMEVFAAMLNPGDTLRIYPMWPINTDGSENAGHTMSEPLEITSAKQASEIRNIYTPKAQGTPITSIDCAIDDIQTVSADKRYVVVLTDGDEFYANESNGSRLGSRTKKELDARFKNAGPDLTIMYLGIGEKAVMPDTPESEYFKRDKAADSADVLSKLTVMCNNIFGRDTLPSGRISGKTLNFDISMSKLIVFVQGTKIDDVSLTLSGSTEPLAPESEPPHTRYSTKGAGSWVGKKSNEAATADESLQGMMVTYTDLAAGTYTLDYTGTASSVEVYYEPDADLAFEFTDAAGKNVDPSSLHEGEYMVRFGMKDGRTGEMIESELLGKPNYEGAFLVDGAETTFACEGYNGEETIVLQMGQTFEAKITAKYLSGYTITKDSRDFGWPEGGVVVAARPAGSLKLEISGGNEAKLYKLQELESGAPYIAKVSYEGKLLTGDELKNVVLTWEPETSNAEVKKTFAEDHYKLTLHYKDPGNKAGTVCGKCTVTIFAEYVAQGSAAANADCGLVYDIVDDAAVLDLDVYVPDDYVVISELAQSRDIEVKLMARIGGNAAPLAPADFARTKLSARCGQIDLKVTPRAEDSTYLVSLQGLSGLDEGDYDIRLAAEYTDDINRTATAEAGCSVTLSNTPLWLKWVFWLGLLLLIIILIWLIMHIKVLPGRKKVGANIADCSLSVGGQGVGDGGATYKAKLSGNTMHVSIEYNGNIIGAVNMNNVTPGNDSYLYKPSKKRSIQVKPESVINSGGTVTGAEISGVTFVLDPNSGQLTPEDPDQKSFKCTNNYNVQIKGKTYRPNGTETSYTGDVYVVFS